MSPEVWLFDVFPDEQETVVLGPLGIQSREGWIFPSYMADRCPGLPNYEALYDCAQAFATEDTFPKGRLITYPSDWGTQSRDLVAMLELPFEPVAAAGEPDMIVEFLSAAKNGEPVLMMFWEPHQVFAEFDIDWVTWDTDEGECTDTSGQDAGLGVRHPAAPSVGRQGREPGCRHQVAGRIQAARGDDHRQRHRERDLSQAVPDDGG